MTYIPLTDARVQGLHICSDFAAIREVARTVPGAMTVDELQAIARTLSVTDAVGAQPWAGDVAELQREMDAASVPNSRFHQMLAHLQIHPQRILDIGPYLGAHGVLLSNRFGPALDVLLYERDSNLLPGQAAMVQRFAKYPDRIGMRSGEIVDLPSNLDVDCLWLGEILEHQVQPYEFLRLAEDACVEGAQVIVSTPLGPWEWQSKEHIHVMQWEPRDYEELARHRPGFSLTLAFVGSTMRAETPEEIGALLRSSPWRYGISMITICTWRVVKGYAHRLRKVNMRRKLWDWGFR